MVEENSELERDEGLLSSYTVSGSIAEHNLLSVNQKVYEEPKASKKSIMPYVIAGVGVVALILLLRSKK